MATSIIKQPPNEGTYHLKMPDGTLMQRGSSTITRAAGANQKAVTFPIEFTAAPYVSVVAYTASPNRFLVAPDTVSKTGFNANLYNTGAATGDVAFCWFAFGRWK